MQSSKFIAIVVAIVAVVWIISGFILPSGAKQKAEIKETSNSVMDVRIRESIAQDFEDDLLITGRSRASRSVDLNAEIEGALTALLKEEGDKITDAEVLAELELSDREAKMKEAKERVNQRQIEYNAAQKLEGKGFNSKIRLAQTLADLEDARAALKQAETVFEKTKIVAPFDGVIFTQDVEVGDFLKVGDPVYTVVDLNPIEFVGFAPERQIHDLALGTKARVELLNGSAVEGTVSYIAPAANEETRTFRVIISAENPEYKIKSGLTARIFIPTPKKIAHKISPSILSLNDAGQIGVKIVNKANKVEFLPIIILSDKPDGMWVSGLSETERIITVGQDFVTEGQVVNPVSSQSEGLL